MTHTIRANEHRLINEGISYLWGSGLSAEVRIHYDASGATDLHSANALLFPSVADLDLAVTDPLASFPEFDLTPEGDALLDLYIYHPARRRYCGNLAVVWKDGKLHAIGDVRVEYLAERYAQRRAYRKQCRELRAKRHLREPDEIAMLEYAAAADPAPLQRPKGFASTGKLGNCAIIAFATLTGVDYRAAEDAIWASMQTRKRNTRSNRAAWNGCCWPELDYLPAAEALGVTGLTRHKILRQQVKTFARRQSGPRAFILMVTRHAMTLKAGLLMDQQGSMPVADRERRSKQFVTEIWTMEG
jgi:hypothetical protein